MHKKLHLSPPQILSLGFAGLIALGTLLLLLPISHKDGKGLSLLDTIFTAASAVCVTGLSVVDNGSHFSLFGQLVILALIQIGGLGFMTFTAIIFIIIRKRISLRDRLLLSEQYNNYGLQGLVRLTLNIVVVTIVIEFLGAVILSTAFIPQFGVAKGIYYSVFHSVSAFCNAGIDVFGQNSSLIPFSGNYLVCLTIGALVILGGLGFIVLTDLLSMRRFSKLTLHTKAVLITTGALLLIGFVCFYLLERNNINTLGDPTLTKGQSLMGAFFQSLTTRTAGFAALPQNHMRTSSKFLSVILMFIGASPASTGGGIKTVTALMMVLLVYRIIAKKHDVNFLQKRFSDELVFKAAAVFLISLMMLVFAALLVTVFEENNPAMQGYGFIDILVESTSAFGTVGLSTGITPLLTPASKSVLIITMFAGRIGPLTLSFTLGSKHPGGSSIKYPEDRVLIG